MIFHQDETQREAKTAVSASKVWQKSGKKGKSGFSSSRFPANDVVAFNYRCHAHPGGAIFRPAFHAHHPAMRADKHFGAMGDFRRQGHGNIHL